MRCRLHRGHSSADRDPRRDDSEASLSAQRRGVRRARLLARRCCIAAYIASMHSLMHARRVHVCAR